MTIDDDMKLINKNSWLIAILAIAVIALVVTSVFWSLSAQDANHAHAQVTATQSKLSAETTKYQQARNDASEAQKASQACQSAAYWWRQMVIDENTALSNGSSDLSTAIADGNKAKTFNCDLDSTTT